MQHYHNFDCIRCRKRNNRLSYVFIEYRGNLEKYLVFLFRFRAQFCIGSRHCFDPKRPNIFHIEAELIDRSMCVYQINTNKSLPFLCSEMIWYYRFIYINLPDPYIYISQEKPQNWKTYQNVNQSIIYIPFWFCERYIWNLTQAYMYIYLEIQCILIRVPT